MTMVGAEVDRDGLPVVKAYTGVDYHKDSHSHVDAFCHVSCYGCLHNGRPADSFPPTEPPSRRSSSSRTV